MGPLVSVVIPAFNARQVIGRTLRSVSAQTYQQLEVLVVDDGSRDGTDGVVLECAATDPRIRLLRQENRGVAAARNAGIEAARGNLVAPLDADDIWVPEKLERQVAVFQVNPPSVGLVYTASAPVIDGHWLHAWSLAGTPEGAVYLPLVQSNFLPSASTPLIRHDCFTRVGLYDSSYRDQDAQGCEDWDLYLRIAELYEFRAVPDCLVGYHQGTETMSSNWRAMDRAYRLLMSRVRTRHPGIPAYVFRWSRANYLVYLATKLGRAKCHVRALGFLTKAAFLDPSMLSYQRWNRLTGKNLLGALRYYRNPIPQPQAEQTLAVGGSVTESNTADHSSAAGINRAQIIRRRTAHLVALQHTLGLDFRPFPEAGTDTGLSA